MSEDQPQLGATYILQSRANSSKVETARLQLQDELLDPLDEELFPDAPEKRELRRVLDLACGSGEWVLRIARSRPSVKVVGVDIDEDRLNDVRQQARNDGDNGEPYPANASFEHMNVLRPLVFQAETFDYVNARFLASFTPADKWLSVLQECHRVLRPGGVIRLTETDLAYVTSPAYERFSSRLAEALRRANMSFSPTGMNIGVITVQKRLLRMANFRPMAQRVGLVNFSAEEGLVHQQAYQNILAAFKLAQEFIVTMKVATAREIEEIYQQALVEMRLPDFCGLGILLTTWGEKTG